MERIKKAYLIKLINKINELEGRPQATYSKIDGNYKANPRNLYLEERSCCYGSYSKTVREVANGGGVSYFFAGQEYYKPAELKMKLEAYLQAKSYKL